MNTLQKSLIAVAAGSLLSVGAQAGIFDNGYAGQPYVGVKAGQLDPKVKEGELKKATAYGVYAGYNFDPNFGAEVEYVGSEKSKYSYTENKVTKTGEGSAKTYGAYGTYRYHVPSINGLYAKGKLGVAKTDISASADKKEVNEKPVGLAGGVGIGFAPTQNVAIEAEYAKLGGKADLISVGAHLKF